MLYVKDIFNQLEEISNCSDNTIKVAIAKTILHFAQERDDFIINDIASCSFTSVSSVTKFCKNLGFAGWKEFYAYLKSEIQEKKEKITLQQISQKNNFTTKYVDKLTKTQLKITNRLINNNINAFLEIHELIKTKQRIFLVADNNNYDNLFHNFTEQLLLRSYDAFLIGSNFSLIHVLFKKITSDDLLIAFFIENIPDNYLINLINDKLLINEIKIKYVILNNTFVKETSSLYDRNPISDDNNGALYSYQKAHNSLFIIFNIILQLLDDFK